ncbi:MAG: hypothetical protein AAGA73_06735 [Pseudomonadota bacterium]
MIFHEDIAMIEVIVLVSRVVGENVGRGELLKGGWTSNPCHCSLSPSAWLV